MLRFPQSCPAEITLAWSVFSLIRTPSIAAHSCTGIARRDTQRRRVSLGWSAPVRVTRHHNRLDATGSCRRLRYRYPWPHPSSGLRFWPQRGENEVADNSRSRQYQCRNQYRRIQHGRAQEAREGRQVSGGFFRDHRSAHHVFTDGCLTWRRV